MVFLTGSAAGLRIPLRDALSRDTPLQPAERAYLALAPNLGEALSKDYSTDTSEYPTGALTEGTPIAATGASSGASTSAAPPELGASLQELKRYTHEVGKSA